MPTLRPAPLDRSCSGAGSPSVHPCRTRSPHIQAHQFRTTERAGEARARSGLDHARRSAPESVAPTMARISSVTAGAFCIGAVPSVRLIPFIVFARCRWRRRFQPYSLVRFGDGVQSPLNASHLQPSGAFGDVGRHRFRSALAAGTGRAPDTTRRSAPNPPDTLAT